MQSLIDTFKKTGALHHSYVLIGDVDDNRGGLTKFCEEELKMPMRGNPDAMVFKFPIFSIGDARELMERQSRLAAKHDGRKIFVIISNFFTRESQNALLKVFEEPTANTHFFILLPSVNGLLPTLLSRVQVVTGVKSEIKTVAKKFLASTVGERLDLTKEIVETGNKREVIDLLNMLEQTLYENGGVLKNKEALENLNHFQSYLYDRGASAKIILEHLAVTLPTVK